jgi:hypothetical protein
MRIALAVTGISLFFGWVPASQRGAAPATGVTVTVAHNPNSTATSEFKFSNVASPVKDDAAAKATVRLVDGDGDPNGAGLNALVDGLWPREEDEPGSNFFFNAGTGGGRFRLELANAIDVAEIRTYSWHPNTRGPQVYTLWVSDGSDPRFNASPRNDVDPATVGWTLLASVDTRTKQDDPGGQYAVSLKRAGGTLGRIRHLLFACAATEVDDDWGNTFYSEIDVIAAAAPAFKAKGKSEEPSHARQHF